MWPWKKKEEIVQEEKTTTSVTNYDDIVHPDKDGFKERVTAKKPEDINMFKCKCGKVHFRHAGYIQTMVPFMRAGSDKRIALTEERVMICVSCKKSYIWVNEQMYDVTSHIDLEAWEDFEVEAQKVTGPGGEC